MGEFFLYSEKHIEILKRKIEGIISDTKRIEG